jgi:hypothetical protein
LSTESAAVWLIFLFAILAAQVCTYGYREDPPAATPRIFKWFVTDSSRVSMSC